MKLTQRFSPKIMKGVYDVDNTRLKKIIQYYNLIC